MSSPPLATAAATIAICSGVTVSLSWPMAMRPTSTAAMVGGTIAPVHALAAGGALGARAGRSRPAGRSRSGPCSVVIVALPRSSPTWPKTVLTEFVSAVVSVIVAELLVAEVAQGTPRDDLRRCAR